MTRLKLVESVCDCERCSRMCQAPCCGTPSDIERLIKAGYADRLCFDDWPGQQTDIHPALKGHEGGRAPFATASPEGCTFWKEGKCELHDKGLKPYAGRYAHHDLSDEGWKQVCQHVRKSWRTKKAEKVIELWKTTQNYSDEHDPIKTLDGFLNSLLYKTFTGGNQ